MSFLHDGDILLCHNIPGQDGSNCTTLVHRAHSHMHVRATPLSFAQSQQCAISLMWLGDVLTDARREDLVTLVYQIWIFSLSMVTLLNESLPHLFSVLAAHVLATAWHVVSAGACEGFDPLGSWWNQTGPHEIAALISNVLSLVMMAGLSYKLFKVYASQTFSRVGASTEIHRVYKLVLVLSSLLQLSGFFITSATALWVSKISFGAIRQMAEHFPIYLAVLIITSVFAIPWLVLGWISVRRESKILFLLFAFISLVLVLMASGMFISPLYRFVLGEWSFYATMSIASYVLLVATSVLAIICRLQFGKGLAHFLRVTEALEDGDFTPVYFSKGSTDLPEYVEDDKKSIQFDPEMTVLGYADEKQGLQRPEPAHARKPSVRLTQLLSDTQSPNDTIKISSTPPLFQSALETKRMSPIMPVSRSPSPTAASRASPVSPRLKGKRPPNIHTGPAGPEDSYELPVLSDSPMSYKQQHARSETLDERRSRGQAAAAAEPARPPQAAVRSRSVPRRGGAGPGLPRRPSDGRSASKPLGGNYF
ncbi:hypothetical protein C8R44DRAFT_3674 [Mycena epipterygia]|nr:hypothetical protein C8R44DRAFT_3674 [Mycena epipterygia]